MIRLSEIVTCLVGIVVFSLIAYLGFLRAVDSFQSADVMAGAIPWPMWPSIGLVPLGAGLITIRLALHLIASRPFTHHRAGRDRPACIARRRRNLRMILTLAMIVLFVLLAIGTPVGFAMAGSGVLGLYLVGGMPMLSGILQTAPLSAVTSYELITIPMFLLMAEFVWSAASRRFVQGDRRLGGPDSRRTWHGDRACRRWFRCDLRHQHGLGGDTVGHQPARDVEAGL
jgi:TRAP-type C4-dicarboxylate transport system permease small subunit